AGARLTGAEERTLARFVRERGQDYCHGCARCRRACPSGVATTAILHALAYEESYGKSGRAREAYAALGPKETASACRDCGTCEKACPYGVAVRSRIREAARLLT
ncbi:MAG: 4Fe-4S dicluster domain-containing protein, partial [Candidatus Aminicenantes bacterium]